MRGPATSTSAPDRGPGLAEAARAAVEEHADQHRPLGSYAFLAAIFNVAFVAFLLIAGRRDRLPDRYRVDELVLLGAATFRVSRLVAKDRVLSFARAPFTRFEDDAGHGEVDESARGRGLQRSLGELLICPHCLAQWIAAAFIAGHALAPRATRATAAMFTVVGLSDVAQLAYSAARSRT